MSEKSTSEEDIPPGEWVLAVARKLPKSIYGTLYPEEIAPYFKYPPQPPEPLPETVCRGCLKYFQPANNLNKYCVGCLRGARKRRNKTHPREPNTRRRNTDRAIRLQTTVEEIEALLTRANGKCEACGIELTHKTEVIDHNHATNKLRGVLCPACNILEGHIGDGTRLEQVLAYRRRHGPPVSLWSSMICDVLVALLSWMRSVTP